MMSLAELAGASPPTGMAFAGSIKPRPKSAAAAVAIMVRFISILQTQTLRMQQAAVIRFVPLPGG
jgi:energy-coupling factor transporter transmembrane protein EcfT